MKTVTRHFILLILLAGAIPVFGVNVYQEPGDFIDQAFSGAPPEPEKLWLTGDLKVAIKDIMGHDMGVLRLRYWKKNDRTAWILEEIGKERPITTGFVVEGESIEQVKVLIFRESRGWEVRYPFFTDQFKNARLVDGNDLDRSIDGISGATLSVNAITRLARVALLLHRETMSGE
ncbi:MAG TPA: FMN-binding protein [Gammaproteobacteria bacterium]|nr:FMN-binding protein [Gammaproteobacteria bacterium]